MLHKLKRKNIITIKKKDEKAKRDIPSGEMKRGDGETKKIEEKERERDKKKTRKSDILKKSILKVG